MPDFQLSLEVIVAIVTIVIGIPSIFFGSKKLYRWFRPIKIEIIIRRNFDEAESDQIRAKVINRSKETHYITRCVARGTYPLSYILLKHFRDPFFPLKFYETIWFSGQAFSLQRKKSLKIEPAEPIFLKHSLSAHPLSKLFTSFLQIELELSNGKTFRSKRIRVPKSWILKN